MNRAEETPYDQIIISSSASVMRSLLRDDGDVPSAVDRFFKSGCHSQPCYPFFLAVLYALMGVVTSIQLIRIHCATRMRRWTMQKGFQALNVGICIFRAASLFAYSTLHASPRTGLTVLTIDVTSMLFFTTYGLLVLFWADIISTTMHIKGPCPPLMTYVVINLAGYVSAALFWSLCADGGTLSAGRRASAVLIAVLDVTAAFGFGYYGRKLLNLLALSNDRSAVLMNKIREVALVSIFSIVCFLWKATLEIISTASKVGLTYGPHGFLDVMFYICTELLIMGSVLVLLSRLPRVSQMSIDQCSIASEGPSTRFYDPYQDTSLETPLIPSHPFSI